MPLNKLKPMRKKNNNRILGRAAHHRKGLLKNLTDSLLVHGSIITTEARGKELRSHFEPLVTAAKRELTLANRRKLLASLRTSDALKRLLAVAHEHKDRPGGYLRLTKLPHRSGDGASTVRVDIIRTAK